MKLLRELVAKHGRRAAERALGMPSGGLTHAMAGHGVFPSTVARISAYFAEQTAQLKLPLGQNNLARRPGGLISASGVTFKEMGAAASLILEALSTVEPGNRARVLDMVRAAL